MNSLIEVFKDYFTGIALPRNIHVIDIIQVLLIAFFIYYVMLWVKSTRAYTLLKGLLTVLLLLLLAYVLRMDTILWIFRNIGLVAITALFVIFQPELRRALEQLGEKNNITNLFSFTSPKEEGRLSDRSIAELTRGVFEMSEAKTGALIVLEQNVILKEYEKTGIPVDAVLSSQLLVNIFEHNTPLHDGAVLVRNNRIVAATCYLPLSDSLLLNKNLGTRHRAGVGISEVSDSLTIIVSEETGKVSYAMGGKLETAVSTNDLREQLYAFQKKKAVKEEQKIYRRWKGRVKNEEKTHK